MRSFEVALFGASWWACVPYERLRIATYLCIWLFAWDDETDSYEYSTLIHDFERSTRFREETLRFLNETLLPTDGPSPEVSSNRIITNFQPVGDAISRNYDQRRIDTFLHELRFFIQMCEEEQRAQSLQELPTLEEYTRRRMGSSAVRVCLAISEYAYNLDIPDDIMRQTFMETIWNETNVIISTVNDILSIKKEIDQEQVDSLIPLLVLKVGSGQQAINTAVEMIKVSIKTFEQAEEDALAHCSDRPSTLKDVRQFIDGCKYACTSNLNWSLLSGRYKLGCKDMKGGITVAF
ncbi:isoprenoid synthase domain-containing protein [Nemania sp. FL0031]|nr:isoprenoid synthase domain-containing protein [Nemania sp. FL0031]